jgi:hypothetical protein
VNGDDVVRNATFVPMAQARSATPSDASGDLAVWRVPQEALINYRYQVGFSSTPPLRGERVHVAVQVPGSTRLLHNAVVEEVGSHVLRYRLHDAVDLGGAAGAPVLNSYGMVVGMHVTTTEQNGVRYGAANPAAAILAELQRSWPG